jgi:hypothetical protein
MQKFKKGDIVKIVSLPPYSGDIVPRGDMPDEFLGAEGEVRGTDVIGVLVKVHAEEAGDFTWTFRHCDLELIEEEEIYMSKKLQIESDGGSSAYYEIPIPVEKIKFLSPSGESLTFKTCNSDSIAIIQVEDVIEFGLDSDFDKANVFKVLYRFGKKAGNTIRYELNKMDYSLKRLRERFDGGDKPSK